MKTGSEMYWHGIWLTLFSLPFQTGIDSDIIDEAIYYFKANVFFKNYEIKVNIWTFVFMNLSLKSLEWFLS